MLGEYRSMEELTARHRSGYAVKRLPYALIQDQVDPQDRESYVWRRNRLDAQRLLKKRPLVGDERVISVRAWLSARKQTQVSGDPPPVPSSSSAVTSGRGPGRGRPRRSIAGGG
jgi:hypothetical protein